MSSVISDTPDIQEAKRGQPESHIWDHFTKASIGSGHYSAKCNYCAASWNRGRPEALKSHLALFCKEVPINIKGEYMELLATGNTSANRKQKESSNDSSAEMDIDKKDKIDQALIRFFICCGIPFSIVDHPYFVDFVQSLCFGYNPPKRTALSTTILNKEISVVLTKIKQELKYEDNLTLGNIL
jgi:BED zinc finger